MEDVKATHELVISILFNKGSAPAYTKVVSSKIEFHLDCFYISVFSSLH